MPSEDWSKLHLETAEKCLDPDPRTRIFCSYQPSFAFCPAHYKHPQAAVESLSDSLDVAGLSLSHA